MNEFTAVTITEERTFSLKAGDRTVTGLAVASTWEGFTKYTTPDGGHLIVLDADKAVITGSSTLMLHLGAGGEPQIGAEFGDGIYAGPTEVDGKPARLILLPDEAKDVSWDTAMNWAKLRSADLPTRAEQRTLYENVKDQFGPYWYWSNTQHADNSTNAWTQGFNYGSQFYNNKSFAGRARAVRRLPI